ncbi:hypothetical protein [Klebsiella pneumoniae]|uniref:hypothetical protein n=1 Tax=Klebsiella pneumoniae TaxID=573 RepID=UPI00396F2EE5
MINVITGRSDVLRFGTSTSFGGGTSVDITGPIEGTNLAYRLIGEYQNEDYWRNFGKTKAALSPLP